jgi:hypothetical protein
MEKIKAALKRVRAVTEDAFTTVEIYDDGSWKLRGLSGDIESFGSAESVDQIVEAIDRYIESLKPKPRPIPEIAKDLVEYVGDGISLPHIRKLVGELKQSVDAYYPF